MAVEVVFYSLAPKPAASGDKTYAATAAGKVARGRKWFRLECRPKDVYQFPRNTQPEDVYDWLDFVATKEVKRQWAAFSLYGDFFTVRSEALDSVPNGMAACENALRCHENGRQGWVVFVPDKEESDAV